MTPAYFIPIVLAMVACAPATLDGSSDDGGGGETDTGSGSSTDTDTDTDADTDTDTGRDTGTDTDTDTESECEDVSLCDDGLDCTEDDCDAEGRCIWRPLETCDWPASLPPDVDALAGLDTDFRISLSGATWNPVERALWVVRGDGARVWRIVEDGTGGWQIEDSASLGSRDIESVVVSDPSGAPHFLHVLVEHEEVVAAFDVSTPGTAELVSTWPTSEYLETSGSRGSEGLAFVPDAQLDAWGFTDGEGELRTSQLGHGGLFFVGTQNGGDIHVFDLSADDDTVEEVGVYTTGYDDTSGLEFDADTGRLYIWHGGSENDLQVVRLSSTSSGGSRSFDLEATFDHPRTDNFEGFALFGTEDCVDGGRPVAFTIDDGGDRALDISRDWPLGCE